MYDLAPFTVARVDGFLATQLDATVQLLTASHLAMLRAVGELGGFSKWAKFYERHREARDKLMALGAVPIATVSSLADEHPGKSGAPNKPKKS